MILPRILVVDDQYYWDTTERNRFLRKTNLAEIKLDTTDDELRSLAQDGKAAGVVLCSGQKKVKSSIINSLDEVGSFIQAGWPSKTGWHWSLIMLDMYFLSGNIEEKIPCGNEGDDAFGLRILDYIIATYSEKDMKGKQTGNSEIPVIILSGIDSDVRDQREPQANLGGAIRYVEKKSLKEETIKTILSEDGLIEDDRHIIIGRSLPILKMLRQARQAALRGRNLLILGQPGSGKTEVAKYVHSHSLSRITDRFIPYYSSPTTEQLQYAEIFGCWYGAHSLADRSYPGKAENAHRGTLFMDEIGNLPHNCQSELLEYGRLLQEGVRSLRRLGNFPLAPDSRRREAENSVVDGGNLDLESHSIHVNVLLIAATNAPIDDSVYRRKHGFRDDLYDRLREYNLPLYVPSLTECTDDIPALFIHYLDRETLLIEGVLPKYIHPEVFEILRNYEWPSNVSGLKSVATHVAWEARYFKDVYVRHLPPLQKPARDEQINTSITASVDTMRLRELEHQVADLEAKLSAMKNLDDLQVILDSILIPTNQEGLKGILPILSETISTFLQKVLKNALLLTQDLDGKVYPNTAVKLLMNKEITASQAYDSIKKICKFLNKEPNASDPLVKEVLEKGIKNRPSNKKKNSI